MDLRIVWKLGGIVASIEYHTPVTLLNHRLAKISPSCVVVPSTEKGMQQVVLDSGLPLLSFTLEETTMAALSQRFIDIDPPTSELGEGLFNQVDDNGWHFEDQLISEFTLIDGNGNPTDSEGELYISSKPIARGYLDYPNSSFVVAPAPIARLRWKLWNSRELTFGEDPSVTDSRVWAANSLLVIYVAAVVQTNLALIKSKGVKLHFSIYEMQRRPKQARVTHPKPTAMARSTRASLARSTSQPQYHRAPRRPREPDEPGEVRHGRTADKDPQHKTELSDANLAALMMFSDAIHAGEIDATKAFTTRGTEYEDVMTVEWFFEQEVIELVVTNPQKPQLVVRNKNNTLFLEEFDFVHLANGTPSSPPVAPGPTVSSAIPSQLEVQKFLSENNLLEDEKIRSGTHIGITGLSLAAYDYVPLVLRHTALIEPTDTGYKIHPENAQYYQGLLTFISRTGVPAPPRHIDPKHFANRRPILTSEEVHALLLQKQFDWLNFWTVFLDANVARSLGKVPADLHYRKNIDTIGTKAVMEDYARQSEAFMHGELTEVGLQRTGYWLVYGGQGFYANPEAAERELVANAPLTRTDRAGFLMRRGSLADITSAAYIRDHSNKAFFDQYNDFMMHCITASPPEIQYLVARMFELGVATHAKGDFNEVVPSLHSNVTLAPYLLDRSSDPVLMSLSGVKEVMLGQPEYAKGRFLRTKDETLVHAIDMGMGGQGTRVVDSSGQQSIIGMRWRDTSFLDAAVSSAANLAPITVLLSSIASQGVQQPAERLLQYYKATLPSQASFEKETAQFAPVWKEMHEKRAFLVLCEKVAGTSLDYLEYTDKVFDATSRKQLVDGLVAANQHVSATNEYTNAVAGIPKFNPPSVNEYFDRFVDLSHAEIQSCWNAHMTAV
ncbi:hypothetical protein B0H13DRAFT_2510767 [Mycena leptocephala]|nr:hypothetical protein B0H13DRAFT_2510767 [Mycena leptocephala]